MYCKERKYPTAVLRAKGEHLLRGLLGQEVMSEDVNCHVSRRVIKHGPKQKVLFIVLMCVK